MAHRIKLPNGEIGEFPDSMTDEAIESVLQKQFPSKKMETDNSNQIPTETTGVTGIASDAMDLFGNLLSKGFDFASDLPKNLEKSGQYIEENPLSSIFHNIGQLGAETTEIGKGIINTPYNLNQYLARKHLLPEVLGRLGKFIPHIPEETGLEEKLGLQPDKEKGDELIRAIPNLASLGVAGKTLSQTGKKIFKGPDLKEAIRKTQSKVNEATEETGKVFEKVKEEVGSRGLQKIPVNKELIKNAQSFLAKTPANKELIKKAKTGDYDALRSLQSDLRVKGEQALSSKLAADKNRGEEIFSTRDQINESIENHLMNKGHEDLAKLLNNARDEYRKIKDIYFSTPSLAKVFGKSQRVPKNPKTLLTEESTEMKKLMAQHPELNKALSKALKHDKKLKNIGRLASALGIGTSAELARELLGGK